MSSDPSLLGPIDAAAAKLREAFGPPPAVAVVLGSGLGRFAAHLTNATRRPSSALGLPASGVPGHAGEVVVGAVGATRVACLSGRVHLYEGHAPATVVLATRALARWGVKGLVLTSAVGGLHREWPTGQVVVVEDHLNLLGTTPLRGPNLDELGPRFPDLAGLYSARARALAVDVAREAGLAAPVSGVYAAMPGPSYETPAEIRMLQRLGGDVVGMSLVPEAIAAGHAGMEVLALAVVANPAAGLTEDELTHADVTAAMHAAAEDVATLLAGVVARW